IWVGMVIAVLCYIGHFIVQHKNTAATAWLKFTITTDANNPERIYTKCLGAMSFITAAQVKQTMLELASSKPKYIELNMSGVPYIDTTGEALLRSLVKYVKSYGGNISLISLQASVQHSIHRSSLYQM